MLKRYKNLKVGILSGLIVGFSVLFVSLMFEGWSQTLVKKSDLLEGYPNREEVSNNCASITDYMVLAERSQSILDRLDRVDNKLDALIFHNGISYNEGSCPRPPCKKEKNIDIASGKNGFKMVN